MFIADLIYVVKMYFSVLFKMTFHGGRPIQWNDRQCKAKRLQAPTNWPTKTKKNSFNVYKYKTKRYAEHIERICQTQVDLFTTWMISYSFLWPQHFFVSAFCMAIFSLFSEQWSRVASASSNICLPI